MHTPRPQPDYAGPERREYLTEDRISLMIEEAVDERVSKMEDKLMAHIDVKFGQIHTMFKEHVDDAFPPGPIYKHKDHHQRLIDSAESAKKIKNDLYGWAIKGSVVFVLGLLGMGALEWLKRELAR